MKYLKDIKRHVQRTLGQQYLLKMEKLTLSFSEKKKT